MRNVRIRASSIALRLAATNSFSKLQPAMSTRAVTVMGRQEKNREGGLLNAAYQPQPKSEGKMNFDCGKRGYWKGKRHDLFDFVPSSCPHRSAMLAAE